MKKKLDFSIRELQLNDGKSIAIPPDSVLVVVGPNNSGKSQFLSDITTVINSGPQGGKVVKGVLLHKTTDGGSLTDWLKDNSQRRTDATGRIFYRKNGTEIDQNSAVAYWNQVDQPLQNLGNFMVFHANTSERLNLVKPSPNFDYLNESPATPLQALHIDEELEEKVSKEVRSAFGKGVFIDRTGNSNIHLFYGTKPRFKILNRPHIERLRETPQVNSQGDGVKSFVGIMLATTSSYYPVLLIDEPEAFLHPPQARLIGRRLTRLMKNGQLVISTHSGDVLQGILSSGMGSVTVVRITREGDFNPIASLDPKTISQLWTDPLLRYSKILDGLFHSQVILCEADADCRWYQAVTDNIVEKEKLTSPEVLFTHCGGKHRMPSVVGALKAINVPIDVIVDIDIYQELNHMEKLVVTLGGKWSDFEADAKKVNQAVNSMATNISVQSFKQQVDTLLGKQSSSSTIDTNIVKEIKEYLKAANSWKLIKKVGANGIPSGPPSVALKKSVEQLRSIGLHVVPEGELEGFVREIDGHGPDWVNKALINKHHIKTTNPARKFIRRIVKKLGSSSTRR